MFFQKEKIENGISYFVQQFVKEKGKNPSLIPVMKFLAYVDFKHLEEYGSPVFDFNYLAMKFGPVPIEIYDEKKYNKCELYEFVEKAGSDKIEVRGCGKTPDIDYFSQNEQGIIEQIISKIATFKDTTDWIEFTHREIKPWKIAWEENHKNCKILWNKHIIPDYEKNRNGLSHVQQNIAMYYSNKEYLKKKYSSEEDLICASDNVLIEKDYH